MSATVDSRVVEMRFDNKQFERNVSTTMSTLDKLKQKLNFTGATKGMEDVGNAAKKIDMTGLGNGVDAVRMKFSALQVMGVTALTRITNAAINAGTRMSKALTIDPLKTGFQEYETQMNAVQTILANTQSKGSTLDDVNQALDTLNTYADKTIYNFTEMTRNIGTFTAAGVDLNTSVNAIQGIANLAAVSGSTSQQASTAMYQLSQALAAGKVSLMDWNSVVNADMGGELFQNALIRTSELLKTGAKEAIKAEGSFRESLTKGQWLTTEVLTETLKQLSGAYSEADLIAQGFSKEQAKEIVQLAQTATDAATKVKTFSQLWDVMKESAQSGWAQTWKLIIGDFEQAKALLTPLADFITGVIGKISDARNSLLESALTKKVSELIENVDGLLTPAKAVGDTLKNVTESVGDFGEIVDKVIGGDFGNGKERFDALTKAGQNYYRVQNKVNEALGNSYRHSDEKIAAMDKTLKQQGEATEKTTEQASETRKLTQEERIRLAHLVSLNDEQLKSKGYTDEQIASLRELKNMAEKLGMTVPQFLKQMDEINGRWLLINSFKNIGQGLVAVIKNIAVAWKSIFPPMQAQQLFNIIAGFHRLTTHLVVSNETAMKVQRTFKGIFAALDIVLTLIGGPLKIAFKAFTQLLGMFDMDILDVTANIGDAIVKFRDWIDASIDFTGIFEKMVPHITNAAQKIRDWYEAIKGSGVLTELVKSIKESAIAIKDWFADLKNSDVAQNILSGIANGIKTGATAIQTAITNLGTLILDTIKNVLGIHSPSVEFHEIGLDSMTGFVNGLEEGSGQIWEWLKKFGAKLLEFVKSLDPGQVFAGGIIVTSLVMFKKMLDIVNKVLKPLEGLNSIFENTAETIKTVGDTVKRVGDSFAGAIENVGNAVSKKIKAEAFEKRSRALLNLAIAIGILAASMFVLSKIPQDEMIKAGIALGALTIAIAALLGLTSLLNKGGELTVKTGTVLGIAASLVIMAHALKQMSEIDTAKLPTAMLTLATAVWGLLMLVGGFDKLTSPKSEASIVKMGGILMKISIALLLMVGVIKLAGQLNTGEIVRGLAAVTAVGLLFAGVIWVSQFAGANAGKAGGMLLLMSFAFLTMTKVIKSAAKLDRGEVRRGIEVVATVGLLFAAVIAVSKLAGPHIGKIGFALTGMATAMFLMVGVIRLISLISPSDVDRGIEAVAKIALIFAGIIAISKLTGQNAVKAGAMLIMMSGALLILTGVIFVLSKLDPSGLDQAIEAIAKLGVVFAGLIAVTKLAQDCAGTVMMLTIAVGALSLALIALSFVDQSRLAGATAAISIAMVAFGLMVAMTKYARSTKTMNKFLIEMMVVIGLLAGVIIALSFLDPASVIRSTAALSTLMLIFGGTLMIISKASVLSTGITKPLIAMIAVVALLGGILAGLSMLPNTESLLPTAVGLSTLLLALSAACLILIPVGKAGLAALKGAGILAAIIVALVAVGAAIGALMAKIPPEMVEQWRGGIEKFMDLLSTIMYGLGDMIGSFVGGFAEGALSGLPEIGNHLSGFMTNAKTFIDGASVIEDDFLTGVRSLAKGIMALTVADMMNGVANFDGSSLAQLGSDLSSFMTNAEPFINSAKTLDASMTEGVKNLAEAIFILTGTGLVESLTSWITGGSSLVDFGKELESFGPSIQAYSQAVQGIDVEAVKTSSEAAKNLAEMASALPNEGGLLGKLVGENNMDEFGRQLVSFGYSLKQYGIAVTGIVTEPILASVEATKALAGMAESVPNFGGVVAFFVGDNDLATFGRQLVSFGYSLKQYGIAVTGIVTEPIYASVEATKALAGMAETIPNMGGLLGFFTGDNDLETFGRQLVSFGYSLRQYGLAVTDLALEPIANSVTAAQSLSDLAKILPTDGGFWSLFSDDTMSMSEFANQITSFGNGMKRYSDAVAGTNIFAMLSAVTAAKSLISLMNSLEGIDTSGVAPFVSAIGTLGTAAVDKFVEAFTLAVPNLTTLGGQLIEAVTTGITIGQSALMEVVANIITTTLTFVMSQRETFQQSGTIIMMAVVFGILDAAVMMNQAVTYSLSDAVDSIRGYYTSFYNAGSYLVTGFCAGITANTFRAEARAAAMATAALRAAEAALGIASPSKVFYQIGDYAGQGFVNGLGDYAETSYKAGSKMAIAAKNGVSETIARIGEAIDSGMDAQPIISPVLDLSQIQNGANQIGGMFAHQSVALAGVNANLSDSHLRAISQMQFAESKNAEVVSAITQLRGDFGSLIKAIGGMHIRMDSGTVVGELVGKIDSSLGQIATHKGRGN